MNDKIRSDDVVFVVDKEHQISQKVAHPLISILMLKLSSIDNVTSDKMLLVAQILESIMNRRRNRKENEETKNCSHTKV